MKKIIIALTLSVVSLYSHAYTGNDLMKHLEDETNVGIAIGYIGGTTDALIANEIICGTDDITINQIIDMTRQMLTNVPQIRNLQAADLLTFMLKKQFPCKKKGQYV